MPILSGTVTFARFHVEPAESFPTDVRRWLSRGLRARAFEPIDNRQTDEERAAGFVELEDHESTEFSSARLFYREHALMAWRIDTLKVPAAALKAEEEDDRLEERLYLAEQLSGMVNALVEAFLAVRTHKRWRQKVVPALKEWMQSREG